MILWCGEILGPVGTAHFVFGISHQVAVRFVSNSEAAVRVANSERLRRKFDHTCEEPVSFLALTQRFLRSLPLGNIRMRTDHSQGFPVFVSSHNFPAIDNPFDIP